MINELKKNGDIITEALEEVKQLSISDIVRDLGIIRCQARAAAAYLLGADRVEEVIVGMAKVYFLK